jgi:hypothetical protein
VTKARASRAGIRRRYGEIDAQAPAVAGAKARRVRAWALRAYDWTALCVPFGGGGGGGVG